MIVLLQLTRRGIDIELCSKVATYLIRTHFLQLTTSQQLHQQIEELGRLLKLGMNSYQLAIGSNIAGLKYLMNTVESKKMERIGLADLHATESSRTKRPVVEVTTATAAKQKKNAKKSKQ
jgi:hypothetical protein